MSKFISKDWLIIALGLFVGFGIGLLVVVYLNENPSVIDDQIQDRAYIRVGADAPDFSLTDLNHQTVQLKKLFGKPIILNFWATWCGPCRIEMPMLESFYQDHIEEIELIAINMQEKEQPVQIFANEYGLDFPLLLDQDAEVSTLYRIHGLPTSIILSAEGKISAVHIGVISESQLIGYLEKMGINDD
jgi:thiol-disulfide isomerase/thioredoxin